jgi:hypothetical protein
LFNLENFKLLIFCTAAYPSLPTQRDVATARILNFQSRRKDSIVAIRARNPNAERPSSRRSGKVALVKFDIAKFAP